MGTGKTTILGEGTTEKQCKVNEWYKDHHFEKIDQHASSEEHH